MEQSSRTRGVPRGTTRGALQQRTEKAIDFKRFKDDATALEEAQRRSSQPRGGLRSSRRSQGARLREDLTSSVRFCLCR